METKHKKTRSNIAYVILLVGAVFILTIVSLLYKFVTLLHESAFATPSFNVLVIDTDAHIVHVDRENSQIAIFTIKDAGADIEKLTNLGASLTFRVPIDARIEYTKKQGTIKTDFFTVKHALASLFNTMPAKYSNMNSADVLKMYIASRGIEHENRRAISRDRSYLKDSSKDIDEELSDLFRDETIFNEKISVEVVNATGIGGFGSRVARVLENAGYNVITVKNGESTTSYIIDRTRKENKTSEQLKRFLRFPLKTDNAPPVADMSIVFGSD